MMIKMVNTTKEFTFTEQELRIIDFRLQILEQTISDAVRKLKIPEDYQEFLINTNYRGLGVRELLNSIYRNDLDGFIKDIEDTVKNLIKKTNHTK